MKKGLLLFFALLMPVLIFLFLKSFGKNEFEVPLLFADSVSAQPDCSYLYQTPYKVADSVLEKLSWDETDSLTIIVFEDEGKGNKHERTIQLNRVFTEFSVENLHVIRVSADTTIVKDMLVDKRLTLVSLPKDNLVTISRCVFLLGSPNDAVIIDSHKRIRGQYNLLKREDADRMIMQEMNILFKKY